MNQLVTAFLPPRVLPKLDLTASTAIPAELSHGRRRPDAASAASTRCARRSSTSRCSSSPTAKRISTSRCSSDFTDAATETRADDAAIVAAAVAGVRALNARYAPDAQRRASTSSTGRGGGTREQGVWMGWERKRGKLAEFNRFMRGGAATRSRVIVGDVGAAARRALRHHARRRHRAAARTRRRARSARWRIRSTARVYDAARGRVVRGYGILQPRVGVSLPSAHRSRFAAIHSGHPGVDPYTTAVSDVYQDLYGEGSFTGKGIYDVDAFERATHGRFPENTLLSHDLIEGSYARAGLVTDIKVYDDYPTRYLTYTRRKHRWIRGDWQLLRWLHAARARARRARAQPPLAALALEDPRQPAAQHRRDRAAACFLVAGWTRAPRLAAPLDAARRCGAIAAPWIVSLLLARRFGRRSTSRGARTTPPSGATR